VRTLRPVTGEELPGYLAQASLAFQSRPAPRQEIESFGATVELDRTLGVFEDRTLVGTAGIHSFRMAVPGGHVPAAGVAGVTVLPTHRRRGVLTDIMRRQLGDVRDRGEPVALLYASEGAIYGRFGFGVATCESELRVARHRNAFRAPASLDGLRLARLPDALDQVTGIVAAATDRVPGAVTRSPAWWRWLAESARPADAAQLELVLRAQGDGFALYERDVDFALPSLHGGSLRVLGLFASSAEGYAALWRYCLDVDLIDEVVAANRPVDEPLRHLLADPRAVETRVWDGLWLRLVDVDAALAGRAYAGDGALRLAVEDAFCPWNAGTYEVGAAGCRRVDGEADLALRVDALAACYLGGNRFTTLARAGLVEERRPGAAALADALFTAPTAPWCAFHF
jgi:predicted acetyltransferase